MGISSIIAAILNFVINLFWNCLFLNRKEKPKPRKLQEWFKFILIPIKKAGLTPNQLTSLNVLSGIASSYFLLTGNEFLFLLFFIFAMLMDTFDGLLARELKRETKFGKKFDFFADFFTRIIIFGSMCIKFLNCLSAISLFIYLSYIGILIVFSLKKCRLSFWYHPEPLFFFYPIFGKEIIMALFLSELFYAPLIFYQILLLYQKNVNDARDKLLL